MVTLTLSLLMTMMNTMYVKIAYIQSDKNILQFNVFRKELGHYTRQVSNIVLFDKISPVN